MAYLEKSNASILLYPLPLDDMRPQHLWVGSDEAQFSMTEAILHFQMEKKPWEMDLTNLTAERWAVSKNVLLIFPKSVPQSLKDLLGKETWGVI